MPSLRLPLTLSWWKHKDSDGLGGLWSISDKRSNKKSNEWRQKTWRAKNTLKDLWVVGERDVGHMNNLQELSKRGSSLFCPALVDQSWAITMESLSTLDKHWHAEGWDAFPPSRRISEVLGHDVDQSTLWPSRPDKGKHCCSFHQREGVCLFTFSAEVWLIKDLNKMTQILWR